MQTESCSICCSVGTVSCTEISCCGLFPFLHCALLDWLVFDCYPVIFSDMPPQLAIFNRSSLIYNIEMIAHVHSRLSAPILIFSLDACNIEDWLIMFLLRRFQAIQYRLLSTDCTISWRSHPMNNTFSLSLFLMFNFLALVYLVGTIRQNKYLLNFLLFLLLLLAFISLNISIIVYTCGWKK